jgi:glutamine synthetase
MTLLARLLCAIDLNDTRFGGTHHMTEALHFREKMKGLDSVTIFFADLNGQILSLPINPDDIETILEKGIGFDGSSVAGFASVDKSDRILIPDPHSFRVLRVKNETIGFFVGRVFNELGQHANADPRRVLENVIQQTENTYGFRFLLGPEHEFFLLTGDTFEEKRHSDQAGYFQTAPHDKGEPVRKEIVSILKSCGIKFEKTHHEVTPSQHEINLECTDPLNAADRTLLFNHITHKVAADNGFHATFMPKPFDGYNRNAFHIHLSMQDTNGNNLFYQQGSDHNLSDLARQFIAGILKYGREASIIMASSYNSYKAYVLEREAPIIRGWGLSNRSSMVRIPYCATPDSTRIELRSPDPIGNMYLQMATLIAMGVAGIENKLDCGKPDMGSTYQKKYTIRMWDKRFLPKSMFEALVEAEKSRFLKTLLGRKLFDSYMTLKTKEWEAYRTHITPKEFHHYVNR